MSEAEINIRENIKHWEAQTNSRTKYSELEYWNDELAIILFEKGVK